MERRDQGPVIACEPWFRSLPLGVMLTDAEGFVQYVNPAMEKLVGYAAHEVVGQPASSITPGWCEAGWRETVRSAAASGGSWEGQLVVRHRSGRECPVEATVSRIPEDGSVPARLLVSAQAAALRPAADPALLAIQNKLHLITAQLPDLIAFLDQAGIILYASPASVRLFGVSPEQMTGRPFAAFLDQSSFPAATAAFRDIIENGRDSVELELRMRRDDGSTFIGVVNGTRLAPAPAPGILLAVRDVTGHKLAAQALRASETRYRSLFESAHDGVLLLDSSGCVDCNEKAALMYGLSKQDVIGRSAIERSPERQPDGRLSSEAVAERIAAALAGRTQRFDWQSRRADGSLFDVEVSLSRAGEEGSGLLLAIVRDITDRQRALAELDRMNRMVGMALAAGKAGAWETNLETGQAVWTREYRQLLGLGPDFVPTTEEFLSLVHPEDRESVRADIRKSIQDCAASFHREFRVALPGGVRWMVSRGSVQCDGSGKPLRMVGITSDITDRKRVEQALRESEVRFRTLVEQAGDEFELFDAEGRYVDVNSAACRDLGYSKEEMLGMRITDIDPLVSLDQYRAQFQSLIGRPAVTFESVHKRKDGSTFPVEITTSVLELGGELRALALARDISERKRAIEERERLQLQLMQAQKMESIGRLAGGVAHDFNNLLTVINGYSQLLLNRRPADDSIRTGIAEIHRAGERAATLTRQLLAFSSKQVLQPCELDLNQAVGEMRPMLLRVLGEDVELKFDLKAESARIYADRHQLDLVVLNLVVNARDAMPKGGKLSIRTAGVEVDQSFCLTHSGLSPGRYVLLSISDTGVGMDEETKRQIFEPFFTTKEIGKGTGLGLSIVQGVVAQSSGCIEVDSQPGQGTTFAIYLPALAEPAADSGAAAEVPELGGAETILVVEDQPEVRGYTVAVLNAYGYRTIPAETAAQALEIFRRQINDIHLVVTDVVMPNTSGRELADRLQELRPGLKILFMSGYDDDAIAHHGVLEQNVQFLQKPFSPDELAIKVRAVLSR